jgi:hypothetical protein
MPERLSMTQTRHKDARGRFLLETDAVDWSAVQAAYEGDSESIPDICGRFNISRSTLHRAVVRFGWRPRQPRRIDRRNVIMRMFRMLDSQIRNLEQNMTKAGDGEAALLGKLVTTLDKLIELQERERGRHSSRSAAGTMTDIKSRLIERIEELKRK